MDTSGSLMIMSLLLVLMMTSLTPSIAFMLMPMRCIMRFASRGFTRPRIKLAPQLSATA
jgi:hypothetical protein